MDMRELLDRYEATGDEDAYAAARPLYENAVAASGDASLLREYGYLLECHAQNSLRRAVLQYERAIQADPNQDKALYQWIRAKAALADTEESIALHRQRLAAAPDEIREYRFLAYAYLVAHDYPRAAEAIEAGLRRAPRDPMLLEFRGDVRAGRDDMEGALADWRHAAELDPENIGPLYSAVFLLVRQARIQEAIAT